MQLGIIGLGRMGANIGRRLMTCGHTVVGYDASPAAVKALEGAVGKYNAFVGSLESQVMTQARRFEELAVDHEAKQIPVLEPVETAPRTLTKLAPVDELTDGDAAVSPPVLTVGKR